MIPPTVRLGASLLALALCLASAPARAEPPPKVGEISALEKGSGAFRTPEGGAREPLSAGVAILVGDQLVTLAGARVKITLNDQSVVMLDERSTLEIDRAQFDGQTQNRSSFVARLGLGRMWAKVSQAVAGSDAKFEVRTERAVAGVRGTVFWVDATLVVKGAKRSQRTRVQVSEGVVAVESTQPLKKAHQKKGQRVQVQGPQEVSLDAWEKRFLELQRGMVVTVDELWTEATDQPEPDGAFARFVRKNDPAR